MSNRPQRKWGITAGEFLEGWWSVLNGRAPLLSIEITRECPLSCPGCYAYGDIHLGIGAPTLREVSDFRGQALVNGFLELVRKHRPLHISLVGGEPMVRRKELDQILPALGDTGIHTLLVTSAVIPIPKQWRTIPRLRVAVSVDGLPEHHDPRRKPATYDRIHRTLRDCTVNIHWTITRAMLSRAGYFEEYLHFWSHRDEVNRIWASFYSPQLGEQAPEILSSEDRRSAERQLLALRRWYPKFLFNAGIANAFVEPPPSPEHCLFSKMSINYTADLKTSIEPCVLGGTPDCSQCGCAASVGLHWIRSVRLAGPLQVGHVVAASMGIGESLNRLRNRSEVPSRSKPQPQPRSI